MLSHEKMIRIIVQILQNAAENGRTVSFKFLYETVGLPKQSTSTERGECHRAMEDAANEICDFRVANFTSLMAKKDTGLPGDGFFDTYRLHRFDEYKSLVGDIATLDLSEHDKKILTNKERERVYRIAGA
ncbi:hypothetical protein [Burkholderia ubonensis]|uniref:hypothetical protein n=1 Tax=Burkholderia ubonensis TaxID=101571 RepID=UPI002AB06712|nr:hypothetical protein [Burkholderia ubonensis]